MGGVGVVGTWPWQQLISTVNLAGMLFLYRPSHRVSCINVCALLYCPTTPPTNRPLNHPFIPQPSSSILWHFTFFLFFSRTATALQTIHDNDIHIMMRLSAAFDSTCEYSPKEPPSCLFELEWHVAAMTERSLWIWPTEFTCKGILADCEKRVQKGSKLSCQKLQVLIKQLGMCNKLWYYYHYDEESCPLLLVKCLNVCYLYMKEIVG